MFNYNILATHVNSGLIGVYASSIEEVEKKIINYIVEDINPNNCNFYKISLSEFINFESIVADNEHIKANADFILGNESDGNLFFIDYCADLDIETYIYSDVELSVIDNKEDYFGSLSVSADVLNITDFFGVINNPENIEIYRKYGE